MNIKFYLNKSFLFEKVLDSSENLKSIRDKYDFIIPNDALFLTSDGFYICKEDESDFSISEIIFNESINMILKSPNKENIKPQTIKKNIPIEGSKFIKKLNGLDLYLYPNIKFNSEQNKKAIKILMVGDTGSGKTTLMNSYLNYLLGIKYEDTFRYEIEHIKTYEYKETFEEIKSYYIDSHNGNPPIIMIDTIGYGDDRGFESDIILMNKIKDFLINNSIEINIICFVYKSSSRLNFLKFYFNNMLDIFDDNEKENFIFMLTFCDTVKPRFAEILKNDEYFNQILSTIEKPWYYCFNSSEFFGSNYEDDLLSKYFFDLGIKNFEYFTNRIMKLKSKCLDISKNVLKEKQKTKKIKPFPKNTEQIKIKYLINETLPYYKYPEKYDSSKKYYTLLVMGDPDSGKDILLDAFVNYLANINYEDPWRYKLIDENIGEKILKSYYINYEREDGQEINIRIINISEFDVLKIDLIFNQLYNFFLCNDELDYILITINSNNTRYNILRQYFLDTLQENLGTDARDKIFLINNFSQGIKPIVDDYLKELFSYKRYFCFNNSVLYTPPELANKQTKLFWKLMTKCIKNFFDTILKRNAPPLSLKLTNKVISERRKLFQKLEDSDKEIFFGFNLLEKSRHLLDKIKKNQILIDENHFYSYKVMKKIPRLVKLDKKYQICNNCKVLCCQVCNWPDNEPYSMCAYFDPKSYHYKGGKCPICPGHCDRYAHIKTDEYTVYDEKECTLIDGSKKKAFEENQKELSKNEELLKEIIKKLRIQEEIILKYMKEIKEIYGDINKIALKPFSKDDAENVQKIIDFEIEEKKTGYENGIAFLKNKQYSDKHLNKMIKAKDISQLFPDYNIIISELKNKYNSYCNII